MEEEKIPDYSYTDHELKGKPLFELGKSSGGRPPKFATPELLLQAVMRYARYCELNYYSKIEVKRKYTDQGRALDDEAKEIFVAKRPMTLIGFCCSVGSSDRWYQHFRKSRENDGGFLHVFELLEGMCKASVVDGALAGTYKENLAARIHGITDKVEVVTTTPKEQFSLENLTDEQLEYIVSQQSKLAELQRTGGTGKKTDG